MKQWVRRSVVLVVLGIVGVGVLPAQAGGPTSVVLSAPEYGKVVATGYQDKAYEELRQLLDTKGREAPGQGPSGLGPSVRAVWMIHDTTPWRRDLIYPDAPGGPWIETVQDLQGNGDLADAPVWHRAADPVRLIKLLVSLKLLHGTPIPQTAPETPTEIAAVDDTPATVLKTEQKPLLGWRWSIPGFLVGAAAAYLLLRRLPRRDWQLVDEN